MNTVVQTLPALPAGQQWRRLCSTLINRELHYVYRSTSERGNHARHTVAIKQTQGDS